MKRRLFSLLTGACLAGAALWSSSCSGPNLFTVQDDEDLGAQIDGEIQADPSQYPLLDEREFPEAYAFLNGIRDEILASGKVDHADEFVWQIKIVDDDSVLNAFSVPGGYLYFYTGLMKYLDTADELAGVLGHEMAHAARRHVTQEMTDQYGVEILLQAALGDNLAIVQDIASGLSSLTFSRDKEAEADEYSVIYLAETRYACDGAAGFFEKLIAQDMAGSTPEFLSDHPSPDNRIEAIENKATSLGCSTTPSGVDYNAFKASLP
jgi:predicted Zn-dependent protease